jgi:sec-independent protein translocase protein TatA
LGKAKIIDRINSKNPDNLVNPVKNRHENFFVSGTEVSDYCPGSAAGAHNIQNRRMGNMFGSLGTTELILILAIVLLIFGVGKLPQLGKGLGQSIREFRSSLAGEDKEEEEEGKEETEGQKEEESAT